MTLVHTDARGRLSLGRSIEPDRDYRVIPGNHGQVILEPVTAISDYERAVLSNPELAAGLAAARVAIDLGQGTIATRRDRAVPA